MSLIDILIICFAVAVVIEIILAVSGCKWMK